MIKVYYRTAAAIAKTPVALAPPEDGLYKEDYEYVTELGDVSLEEAFRVMNVVDGDEDYEKPLMLGVRSMMCGDVVVDEDGDVWFCAGTGWEETSWW